MAGTGTNTSQDSKWDEIGGRRSMVVGESKLQDQEGGRERKREREDG
jgi:hypothetical protein